jgi:hypothetical protein
VRTIGGVALLLAGALVGCDAPHAATPRLWTVADVQAIYPGGEDGEGAIATDAGLPGGVKVAKILDPADPSKLFARATIAEHYNGTYLTTEVWSHFDQVWLQPMYIPAMVDSTGALTPLGANGSGWVFGVGPDSRFYSPFWQMVYVLVDADTPPITSARQVLDGKHQLQFGPGRTVSLIPDGISPPPPVKVVDPLLTTGSAWVDGRPVSFVDFGKATFTWNDEAVIDELPIFVLLMRRKDTGELVAPDIPTVAGTGPLGSGGPPAPIIKDQNRYVAYWRIYTVTLPPTARVYSPPQDLRDKLNADHVPVVESYNSPGDMDPDRFGWVALNPSDKANGLVGCFESLQQLDPDPMNEAMGKCIWLDSQAAIENNVDRSAIQRTDVTVTCPFVYFNTYDVSPIK